MSPGARALKPNRGRREDCDTFLLGALGRKPLTGTDRIGGGGVQPGVFTHLQTSSTWAMKRPRVGFNHGAAPPLSGLLLRCGLPHQVLMSLTGNTCTPAPPSHDRWDNITLLTTERERARWSCGWSPARPPMSCLQQEETWSGTVRGGTNSGPRPGQLGPRSPVFLLLPDFQHCRNSTRRQTSCLRVDSSPSRTAGVPLQPPGSNRPPETHVKTGFITIPSSPEQSGRGCRFRRKGSTHLHHIRAAA